jgi:hypothetical protein
MMPCGISGDFIFLNAEDAEGAEAREEGVRVKSLRPLRSLRFMDWADWDLGDDPEWSSASAVERRGAG